MKITVFRRPDPKQFEYKPLYYSEREEEIKQIQEKYDNPDEARRRELFREQIERRWNIHRTHQRKGKTSNPRLLFYLLIIGLIVYYLYFSNVF